MTESNCAVWCQDPTGHASEVMAEDRICYRHAAELELSTDQVTLEADGVYRGTLAASLLGSEGGPTVELSYREQTAGRLTLAEAEAFHAELGKLLAAAKA